MDIHDAMALAVCDELWKSRTDNHPPELARAWLAAWKPEIFDNAKAQELLGRQFFNWDVGMSVLYPEEIDRFAALGYDGLRATLRIMTYEAGLPFFCAVTALSRFEIRDDVSRTAACREQASSRRFTP